MKTKTLTKIISLVLINALTALLIFQINFAGGKSSPTKAQTVGNYSATWTPAKCRIVSGTLYQGGNDVHITIGVAEWNVEYSGDYNGKEKWVVPDDPNNANDGWLELNQYGSWAEGLSNEQHITDTCGSQYRVTGSESNEISTTGLYGYTMFDWTGDDDEFISGGSYPKGWKVCKVNAFTDPC